MSTSEHRIRTRYRSNRAANGSNDRRHLPPPSITLSHVMDSNNGGIANPAFADEGGGNENQISPPNGDPERLQSPAYNGKKLRERKQTKEALHSSRDQRRATIIKRCREILTEVEDKQGKFTHMETLLENKDFTETFFELFDTDASKSVSQTDFFEILRVNLRSSRFSHKPQEFRSDVTELIETVTYLVIQEADINSDTFHTIINSRGVANKLYILADYDKSGDMDVEEMMNFLLNISKPVHVEDFNTDQVKILEEVFKSNLPHGQDQLSMKEFKQIMPSKNEFFLERAFKIFDQDGNGTISMAEFFESMNTFAAQGPCEKIIFLFKIYDIDGDGALQLKEIESIIRASLTESGMKLPESDIQDLAFALYEEALGENAEEDEEITIDQLTEVFSKHEGLLEGLNLSLAKWLTPQRKETRKNTTVAKFTNYIKEKLSIRHIRSNWQFFAFLFFLFTINVILFVTRAYYFRNFRTLSGAAPNGFYMMSRANGRVLLFNSMMILVLVLRYTITKMRDLGFNAFLPIDNNIYLHKLLGIVSFIQAWFHTIMHICNFSINVAPDPVKFVQLTEDYWYNPTPHIKEKPNWSYLGYQIPEGCIVETDYTKCPEESIDLALNATICQICPGDSMPWNIGDWLFTMRPGVFGIIGGIANPTGFALIIIFTIMFICSLPFVRKTGHFQVFYFTHLMYWAYFILLILHAPEFWKWVIVPFCIYVLERLYRGLSTVIGQGKSTIIQGVVLPSKVTRLDINRPANFRFSPGDWVFIRIPKIAQYEWHPFTISSAPERSDAFTLHIRGVGQWTNRLYNFFEERKQEKNAESRRQSTKLRHGDSMKGNPQLHVNLQGTVSDHPKLKEKLEIHIDGPFGAPASSIFRAEHAVLIATGIGVTPFSSILQSIMARYYETKRECPKCTYRWSDNLGSSMMNLKKVDFIWINRDQNSFEWFTKLLHQIEVEQCRDEGSDTVMNKFMDIHMYFTAALQKTDMRAIGLQVALDILHKKENRDLVTGLKAKTNAGRPHWNRVFSQIRDQRKGRVTVFYCGNPHLARTLREKCEDFGFNFRKEVF